MNHTYINILYITILKQELYTWSFKVSGKFQNNSQVEGCVLEIQFEMRNEFSKLNTCSSIAAMN